MSFNSLTLVSTFSQLHLELLKEPKSELTLDELLQEAVDSYRNGTISREEMAFRSFKAMYTNADNVTITNVVEHCKD